MRQKQWLTPVIDTRSSPYSLSSLSAQSLESQAGREGIQESRSEIPILSPPRELQTLLMLGSYSGDFDLIDLESSSA